MYCIILYYSGSLVLAFLAFGSVLALLVCSALLLVRLPPCELGSSIPGLRPRAPMTKARQPPESFDSFDDVCIHWLLVVPLSQVHYRDRLGHFSLGMHQ